MSIQVAYGTTVTFSGFSAKVISIDPSGDSVASIETTALDNTLPTNSESGGKTFVPSTLGDPGTIGMEIYHDGESALPSKQTVGALSIAFPDGTGLAWTGAFLQDEGIAIKQDDVIKQTITFKLTGIRTPDTTPTP